MSRSSNLDLVTRYRRFESGFLQRGVHANQLVLGLFRGLAKREGRAVLIVTHDPNVRAIADRVLSIRDGLLTEGGPDP